MSTVQYDPQGNLRHSVLDRELDWQREATEVNLAEVRRSDSPLDHSAEDESPWIWRIAGVGAFIAAAIATWYYRALLFS
ncbi:MAG TPA: hypothetical protein VEI97_15465 [bacterium]|nr:hypothetical protein [bacterium]